MSRKNRSTFPKAPIETISEMDVHLGNAWNQRQLQGKYVKELEARYTELNGKKRLVRSPVKPLCPVKAKGSPSAFGTRCTARPNPVSSANKSPLIINDRINRTAYKEMDGSERFFEIIRDSVNDTVQKRLSELVEKQFKGVINQVDDLSLKLANMENNFQALYSDLHNKITHYGEEHSRHFRYICMKMEYDKIFYQHMNGLLRQDHIANGYYSCGQNLAQDLLKYPSPSQCPCVQEGRLSKEARAEVAILKNRASDLHSSHKGALTSNSNLACGDYSIDHDKKESSSSKGSQRDLGKMNPDLSLKHYYQLSRNLVNKLEKGFRHADDDQSDRASGAQSEVCPPPPPGRRMKRQA